MIPWPTRVFLFLSSYLPLWAIIALLGWQSRLYIALVAIGAGATGAIGLAILLSSVERAGGSQFHVASASRRGGDSLAYIMTYIFPFLSLLYSSLLEDIGILLLFIVTMLVYVSSDMLYVNPLLTLAKFKTYSVQTQEGGEIILVTKNATVIPGQTVTAVQVTSSTWWEK